MTMQEAKYWYDRLLSDEQKQRHLEELTNTPEYKAFDNAFSMQTRAIEKMCCETVYSW